MRTRSVSPISSLNKLTGMNVPRGFMSIQQRITKILSTILIATLWITPGLMHAAVQQQNSQPPASPSQEPAQQQSNPQAAPDTSQETAQPAQNQQNRGTKVDPSQAPLQPVTTYPDAPTPQQDQQPNAAQPAPTATTTTTQPAPEKKQQEKQPVGAATAESVPTSGGAAAKPAGVAIAPAKQHQTRSLLIKIGAFAAAGVAAGTIYGLSRGTSSKPPGTAVTGATAR